MLFYVNVQNKTKFKYKDVGDVTVGDSYEYVQKIANEDRKGNDYIKPQQRLLLVQGQTLLMLAMQTDKSELVEAMKS